MNPSQRDPGKARDPANQKVCIIGASGKLGQYMVQHALDRGYEVVGVCRDASVEKLDAFKERITVIQTSNQGWERSSSRNQSLDGVLETCESRDRRRVFPSDCNTRNRGHRPVL